MKGNHGIIQVLLIFIQSFPKLRSMYYNMSIVLTQLMFLQFLFHFHQLAFIHVLYGTTVRFVKLHKYLFDVLRILMFASVWDLLKNLVGVSPDSFGIWKCLLDFLRYYDTSGNCKRFYQIQFGRLILLSFVMGNFVFTLPFILSIFFKFSDLI